MPSRYPDAGLADLLAITADDDLNKVSSCGAIIGDTGRSIRTTDRTSHVRPHAVSPVVSRRRGAIPGKARMELPDDEDPETGTGWSGSVLPDHPVGQPKSRSCQRS
jgi:hypothetical protein